MARRRKMAKGAKPKSVLRSWSGTLEDCGPEFAPVTRFTGVVWTRDRLVHRLVLLGATAGLAGGASIACSSLQVMTLQRIQNQHHPAISHDGGALKLLALFQAIA
jgi:hypothetical protein